MHKTLLCLVLKTASWTTDERAICPLLSLAAEPLSYELDPLYVKRQRACFMPVMACVTCTAAPAAEQATDLGLGRSPWREGRLQMLRGCPVRCLPPNVEGEGLEGRGNGDKPVQYGFVWHLRVQGQLCRALVSMLYPFMLAPYLRSASRLLDK